MGEREELAPALPRLPAVTGPASGYFEPPATGTSGRVWEAVAGRLARVSRPHGC